MLISASALLMASTLTCAVPPRSEKLLMGVLVAVLEPNRASPSGSPELWINRATWNRLRIEAGVAPECDHPGLTLEVVTGEGAKAWGIAPGSTIALAMTEGGMIGVPESILPDETWFVKGVKAVGNPCPSGPPASQAPPPQAPPPAP